MLDQITDGGRLISESVVGMPDMSRANHLFANEVGHHCVSRAKNGLLLLHGRKEKNKKEGEGEGEGEVSLRVLTYRSKTHRCDECV